MASIYLSGINNNALTAVATTTRSIASDEAGNAPDFATANRVFELLSLSITNEHATQVSTVTVYDAAEAASPSVALKKLTLLVPPQDTLLLTWRAGSGPQFITSITAALVNGTISAADVHSGGRLI